LAAADVPQRQQAHGYANLRRAVFDARDAAADVELRIKQRNTHSRASSTPEALECRALQRRETALNLQR